MPVVLRERLILLFQSACWVLIHLAIHPEWKEKCRKEIQDLIARHVDDSPSTATLYEKLAAIPLSAWEDELPVLDACTRESQRTTVGGALLRRNLRGEVRINEQVVKRGDFLAYPTADVHLNPEYYPDPYKYDPGRWLRPDPVPNTAYPFVGWGAGRHPCPGMRVAKLEIKLILAIFLMRYEFDLVDEDGKFPDPLPVPDRNAINQVRVGLRMRSPIWMLMLSSLAPTEPRPTSTSRRLSSRRAVTHSPTKSHPTPSPILYPSDLPPGEEFTRRGTQSCVSHYNVICT
jgi:cytochrome P450